MSGGPAYHFLRTFDYRNNHPGLPGASISGTTEDKKDSKLGLCKHVALQLTNPRKKTRVGPAFIQPPYSDVLLSRYIGKTSSIDGPDQCH